MHRVCRPAVFLCALFACSSLLVAQSWVAPTAYPAGADAPKYLLTADLLGNQTSDVLAVSTGHNLLLYQNDGAGHLGATPQIVLSNVSAATAAKFSGTTMDDLLVISSATASAPLELTLMPSDGSRAFGSAIVAATQLSLDSTCQLTAADFNDDGIPDVLVACPSSNSLLVGINNGKGVFAFKSVPGAVANGRQMLNVSAGDLDGDGLADIVVQSAATYSPTDTRVDVLWNSSSGNFSPQQGYVSLSDVTGLYVAKVDGHASANLAGFTSASASVFEDQSDRNTPGVFSALQVASDCNVVAVTSGRIVSTKYSLGQDVIAAATCSGQSELLVYPNNAQTSLTLTPSLSYSGGVPALSLLVNVASSSGDIVPTGSVAVSLGSTSTQGTLTNGISQIDLQPVAGTNVLRVSYSGDGNDAGASETSNIILAGGSPSVPPSLQIDGPTIGAGSSLSTGLPYPIEASIDLGQLGTRGVRSPVTGDLTFTDNGNLVASVQGKPAYSLSPWESSDCSWSGSSWTGTQCMADGSGSYQVAYEQDLTTFTSQDTFSSSGTHLLAASYTDAAHGSVSNSIDVTVNGGALSSTSNSPAITTNFTRSAFVSHSAFSVKPMAQSSTTSFGVNSNNNPSTAGQAVTFTTSYPASGNGTWNYYDNGALLGPASVQKLSSPEGIAVNSSNNYIYVSNYGNNTVSVINGANDYIVATVPVGSNPQSIAVDNSNGYIYVADYQGSSISVISSSSNSVIATIAVGEAPHSITVNPNTHTVYEVDISGVKIINGLTFTVTGTVPGGCAAEYCNIAVNPNTNTLFLSTGQYIYTVNLATNTTNGGQVLDSPYQDANASIAVDSATNVAYIYEFDNSSGSIVGAFNGSTYSFAASYTSPYLASYPSGIAVNSSTGEFCYITQTTFCGTGNSLISTGANAAAIAVNPATNTFYVADSTKNTISVISGATNTITNTIGMTAIYTTSSLSVGTHPITSTYSGDVYVNPAATSAILDQVVNGITPSISVSCSPNPITYGSQNTSCITSVSGGVTGTVSWTINGGAWTNTSLNGGVTSAGGFAGYGAGNYTIGVTYNGDSSHNPASSSTILTIDKANTTITGGFAANPITYGQAITVSGNVSCNSACGNLQYFIDGNAWGINSLSGSGAYVAEYAGAAAGLHTIQVNYLGDVNHNPSSWGPATLTVINPSTSTLVWSNLNPSPAGQAVQVFAEVLGNGPTGNVSFTVDGNASGSSPPLFAVTTTNLLPNSNSLSAWYTTGVTLTPNAALAPDGSNTAWLIQDNASYYVLNSGSCSSGPITYSVFAKQYVANPVPGFTFSQRYFDSSGAIIGAVAFSPVTISQSWQRYSLATVAPAGTVSCTMGIEMYGYPSGAGLYLWGAQVENATSAGPYVPTGSSSASGTESIASIPVAGLAPGNHSIVASYSGNEIASTSPDYNQVVTTTNSISSLESSLSPSTFGQSVTFTDTISTGGYTPTGSVIFSSDGNQIGTGTVSPISVTNLATYSNDFTKWSVDGDIVAAPTVQPNVINGPDGSTNTAAEVTYPVTTPGYSEIVLPVANGISYANQTMTFSVWVEGTTATQPLQMYLSDEPYTGKAVALSICNATQAWQRCSVTYTYPSDAGTGFHLFLRVASEPTSQTFYFWGAQFEQASNPGPYVATDGSPQTGFGGIASVSTSSLLVGSHTIAAVYGGDSVVNASTAPTITQVVNVATPTVTLSSSLNPSTYGQAVTFTANVPSGATGTISFTDNGTAIGSAPVSNGTAQISTSSLAIGSHSIVANYGGDSSYAAASSLPLSQMVNQAATSFILASSSNPSIYGSAVTFTASGPPAATGLLTFYDGTKQIGTGTLSGGSASVSVPLLAAGTHSITVQYPGDTNFLASTSLALTQTVNTAAVGIAITSTVNPSNYGQTVTFTFTFKGVTGGAVPTGTALVTDGVNNLGTLTLNSSGVATFTTSTLVAGTHSITAAYQGDSNYH